MAAHEESTEIYASPATQPPETIRYDGPAWHLPTDATLPANAVTLPDATYLLVERIPREPAAGMDEEVLIVTDWLGQEFSIAASYMRAASTTDAPNWAEDMATSDEEPDEDDLALARQLRAIRSLPSASNVNDN